MSSSPIFGPIVPGTAPDLATTQGRATSREIPNDILQQASKRLAIATFMMAFLYVVGWAFGRAAIGEMFEGASLSGVFGADLIVAVSVACSLALSYYAKRATCPPESMINLGLMYMVGTAFVIALLMHWIPMPQHWAVTPMITWIGPIMLMFAAILPSTTGKTVVAGLLAASMNPIAMMMAKARGVWDYGSESKVLLMHYPDFLLIPVAVVISRVVIGLGHQVAKAREMGSYQLGERIGRGAMGDIYKATHRMFARPAAIKLIRPDIVAPGDVNAAALAVKRFRREAEAAAQLRSPHTVALYDFGVTSDQTLYFVMELLEGMDLQTLVATHGPLPANRVIYILRQVCESLEEAHANGLVHRDVKPANIHVGRVGLKHDFVKVLDFGLVKWLDKDTGLESQATQDGRTPGTPAYMPPEAVRGDAMDGRADIYALGCVAYYLLTGLMVFEADSGLKMIASHLQTVPVRPSKRAKVKVPEDLEDLIMSCLEKKPEDRPAGAHEIRKILKGMSTNAWTQADAVAWWQTHSGAKAPATEAPMLQQSIA